MTTTPTLYLDTEFNGHGGQLISLALIGPLLPMFYAVCDLPEKVDPWVANHVVPKLYDLKGFTVHSFDTVVQAHTLSPQDFRTKLQWFISQFNNPTIICDWHADAVHFLRLLEGPDFGSSLDFPCEVKLLKTPPGEPVSKCPHNALADAHALMQWHLLNTQLFNEEMS